jgi:TolB-like protein
MKSDFQLGAWRVQPQLNSLVCDRRTVHLEPKMMGVLLCLAQRSGDVVPKEQLVQEVWRDTFVTDDVLIRCVSALRKAFSDNAETPTVIETIPKRGYRLLIPAVPIARATLSETRSVPDFVDSIAVLPFENSGSDPEMEYLSDGFAESLINSLSRLQDLRVVPRTTTFQYKRKCMNPTQVGRELAARLVLAGYVAQRGNRLVVGAELIDTVRESQLWGQTYDRGTEEIFAIQEEIAGKIPQYLQLPLCDAAKRQITKRSTESREAYHLYLKAMHFAHKHSPEGFRKGLDYCRRAIEVDPVYAAAYAGLSYLYSLFGTFGVIPALEAFPRAKAAALKALEVDDGLSEAHAVLGFVHLVHDWELENAESEFSRAIELGPHMPGGHYAYSHLWLAKGNYTEAIREATHAVDLDPLSLPNNYHLGAVYHFARDYGATIAQLRKTSELDSSFVVAHARLAIVYAEKGMFREAMAEAERARSVSEEPWGRIILGKVHAVLGNRAEARQILDEVKLSSTSPNLSHAMYCAMMHAWLGEHDQAFEWLDKAYAEREPTLIYLSRFPDFESLHGDPQFGVLLRRIGLAS